jgi:hypothetical protein
MADELKCCPFCSGDGAPATVRYSRETVDEQGWGQSEYHYVSCVSCGANNCGIVGHRTPERAADHWNRRAPLTRADNPPGEGVVVVPVEPTPEMIRKGADTRSGYFMACIPGVHTDEAATREVWRAMVKVATTAPPSPAPNPPAPRPAAPGDGEVEAIVSEVASIIREDASIDIHFDITNADDLARSIVSRALAPSAARDEQTGGG